MKQTARDKNLRRGSEYLLAETARKALPIHVYLFMLDQAARTGLMPVVDEHGKIQTDVTGKPLASELRSAERIALAQYLVNKVLPDVPKEVFHVLSASTDAQTTPIDKLPHLSTDALRAIANGTTTIDADFEVTDEKP